MNARKSAVIAAAKANGVRRVKGQAEDIMVGLGNLRRQATVLMRKGKGNKNPASSVYSTDELYAIGKAARVLMAQIQNTPDDQYGTVRDIAGSLKIINDEAQRLVKYVNNPRIPAEGMVRTIDDLVATVDSAIKQTQYLMGGNRRVRR